MSDFDPSTWRLGSALALAVASAAGAAVSTTVFGTETYAVQLCFPGSTSSTGGCRVAVIDIGGAAVSSTQGTLLPANSVYVAKVTPGQRVSAISNDAGTFSLSVTELTK
jgi:hypothetical protein